MRHYLYIYSEKKGVRSLKDVIYRKAVDTIAKDLVSYVAKGDNIVLFEDTEECNKVKSSLRDAIDELHDKYMSLPHKESEHEQVTE